MNTNEKNILRRKKAAAIALAGILSTTTLTGCNHILGGVYPISTGHPKSSILIPII